MKVCQVCRADGRFKGQAHGMHIRKHRKARQLRSGCTSCVAPLSTSWKSTCLFWLAMLVTHVHPIMCIFFYALIFFFQIQNDCGQISQKRFGTDGQLASEDYGGNTKRQWAGPVADGVWERACCVGFGNVSFAFVPLLSCFWTVLL